jgi:hypothetical protein
MPASFPETEFRAFGIAASNFFPGLLSDEVLYDPQERRRHFDLSWQAVRYRYRSCAECSDEFKALLDSPSQMWQVGWGDEELTYKLERCIYVFFIGALSVFDSFALSLYFLGNAMQPAAFPDVASPRKITRTTTHKAMSAAFPHDAITRLIGACRRTQGSRTLIPSAICWPTASAAGAASAPPARCRRTAPTPRTSMRKPGTFPAQPENSSLTGRCCSVILTTSPPCCLRSPGPRGLLLNHTSP